MSVRTLDNYITLLDSPATYRTLLNAMLFVVPSLSAATLIALVFAWLIERTNLPWRGTLFVMLIGQSGIPLWLRPLGLSFTPD